MSRHGRRRGDILEIPESDQSDQSDLGDDDIRMTDQSNSRTISPSNSASDTSEHSFINIEKHFPKGRGLFLPTLDTAESDASAAPTNLSQANASQQPDPIHNDADAAPLWSDSTDLMEIDDPVFVANIAGPLLPDRSSAAYRTELSHEDVPHGAQTIKSANALALRSETEDKYERILAGIEAVIRRYDQESASDVGDLNEIPVQWPFPKQGDYKNARICLCKRQTVRSRIVSECQRCYDPACEIAGGWYHLKCLAEDELREVSSSSKWICRRCIARRETHGFPEIHASSIVEERRDRLIRTVVAWNQTLPVLTRDNDGLTAREREATAQVDQWLKKAKKWPFREDDQVDNETMDDDQEKVSTSSGSSNARIRAHTRCPTAQNSQHHVLCLESVTSQPG